MTIKKAYRLHRILSTIIGIPIFLWAVSGLMHPLMTNVRPAIKTQSSPVNILPASELRQAIPLTAVLQKAGIGQFFKMHLIRMDSTWYYQVLTSDQITEVPRYFNLQTGQELIRGNRLYAIYLARHFLGNDNDHTIIPEPIESIKTITHYTTQYTYVNRLLPVEKVSFLRADQIAIYVDTHNSQFAFALDHHRATFNQFFGWFHTWSWMDSLPKLKAAIIALILLMALFTASLGIYLTIKTRSKKNSENPLNKARKLHRSTAIIGAFFLLAWAFSGLVHAVQNGRTPFKMQPISSELTSTWQLPPNLNNIFAQLAADTPLSSISLMQLDGKQWIATVPYGRLTGSKDLMKSQGVKATQNNYYTLTKSSANPFDSSLRHYSEEEMMGLMARRLLVKKYKLSIESTDLHLTYLTHFTAQYNFSDKILPVWQIRYGKGHKAGSTQANNQLFIDPKQSALVKVGDPFKQADALIFAFFHKHEFMGWAGKSAKDTSTVIGILLLLTLLIVGYRLLFIKWRQQGSKTDKD